MTGVPKNPVFKPFLICRSNEPAGQRKPCHDEPRREPSRINKTKSDKGNCRLHAGFQRYFGTRHNHIKHTKQLQKYHFSTRLRSVLLWQSLTKQGFIN